MDGKCLSSSLNSHFQQHLNEKSFYSQGNNVLDVVVVIDRSLTQNSRLNKTVSRFRTSFCLASYAENLDGNEKSK